MGANPEGQLANLRFRRETSDIHASESHVCTGAAHPPPSPQGRDTVCCPAGQSPGRLAATAIRGRSHGSTPARDQHLPFPFPFPSPFPFALPAAPSSCPDPAVCPRSRSHYEVHPILLYCPRLPYGMYGISPFYRTPVS